LSDLFEQATSVPALLAATRRAARGKRHRPDVARFLMDAEPRCLRLGRALRRPVDEPGAWQPGATRTLVVRDPKPRRITIVPFPDRVVHHALCAPAEPHLERFAIAHSFACRRGKGQLAALRRAQRATTAADWVFKGDVRRFFASIPHDRLLALLRRHVPDSDLCDRLEVVVRAWTGDVGEGRGLPVGSLTSQHLANLYLGVLDHRVKDDWGVRHYLRYMDDFLLFGERERLRRLIPRLRSLLAGELGLALNERVSRLARTRDGVPFLGWRVSPTGVVPRPETRRRVRRAAARVEAGLRQGRLEEEEAAASMQSRLALWALLGRGGDTHGLFAPAGQPAPGLHRRGGDE